MPTLGPYPQGLAYPCHTLVGSLLVGLVMLSCCWGSGVACFEQWWVSGQVVVLGHFVLTGMHPVPGLSGTSLGTLNPK